MNLLNFVRAAFIVVCLNALSTSSIAQQLVNFSCPCGEAVTGFDAVGYAICKPFNTVESCLSSSNYSLIPETGQSPGWLGRVYKTYINFSNQQYWPNSPYGSLNDTTLGAHTIILAGFQHVGNNGTYYFSIGVQTENIPADYISEVSFADAGIIYDFTQLPVQHVPNWLASDTGADVRGTLWQFVIPQADYDAIVLGGNNAMSITITP